MSSKTHNCQNCPFAIDLDTGIEQITGKQVSHRFHCTANKKSHGEVVRGHFEADATCQEELEKARDRAIEYQRHFLNDNTSKLNQSFRKLASQENLTEFWEWQEQNDQAQAEPTLQSEMELILPFLKEKGMHIYFNRNLEQLGQSVLVIDYKHERVCQVYQQGKSFISSRRSDWRLCREGKTLWEAIIFFINQFEEEIQHPFAEIFFSEA